MEGFKLELTFDKAGNLNGMKYKGDSEKEYKEWQKLEMPLELNALEKVIPLTLAYIHSSPGHWCLIMGQWRWCP
jgi:hypothetical protein